MTRLALLLALAACAAHPTAWRVELLPGVESEPAGWREVMDAARAESPCSLRGEWGGTITVHPAPYVDGWGILVAGNVTGDHAIGAVWTRLATEGAIPEEACHVGLNICSHDYREAPAKACAERVRNVVGTTYTGASAP